MPHPKFAQGRDPGTQGFALHSRDALPAMEIVGKRIILRGRMVHVRIAPPWCGNVCGPCGRGACWVARRDVAGTTVPRASGSGAPADNFLLLVS